MDRQIYFDELRATSNYIRPYIRKYLSEFTTDSNGLADTVNYLTSERIKDDVLLLKPFLVRLAYEAAGGTDWKKIAPVCAAAEILNISTYQSNLSFDGKFRVLNQTDRSNQFIASYLLRETVTKILHHTSMQISEAKVKRVLECFSHCNTRIYIAQHCDLNQLVRRNLDRYDSIDKFLEDYTARCLGLSGIFSEQCAYIGGFLADAEENILESLKGFGRNFGIGLQIVNDIGDLLPPNTFKRNSFRLECDQLGDLRRGKLTLPIFILLKGINCQNGQISDIYNLQKSKQDDLEWVLQIMIESGAINFSKKLAKQHMRMAKKSLIGSLEVQARKLLSIMASQIRSNKFFAAIREFEDERI